MTQADSPTEAQKVLLAPFDLSEGTSESTRAKTAETFLELLGARVRNPNKPSPVSQPALKHSDDPGV
jgi:hypothetical protein